MCTVRCEAGRHLPENRCVSRSHFGNVSGRQDWMVGGYRRELASPAAYIEPRHRSDSASDGELRRCRRRLKTTPSKAGPDSATVDRSAEQPTTSTTRNLKPREICIRPLIRRNYSTQRSPRSAPAQRNRLGTSASIGIWQTIYQCRRRIAKIARAGPFLRSSGTAFRRSGE